MSTLTDLDTFLATQAGSEYAFVIIPIHGEISVKVVPYSPKSGPLEELSLTVPKTAISSVISTPGQVEIGGSILTIVNLQFDDKSGAVYQSVFTELVRNRYAIVSALPASGEQAASTGVGGLKPMRDWCGWHWPTPQI